MTRTKTRWLPCNDPTADCGQWITPPQNQGQIVLVSYACGDDGVIFRRSWDQSDGQRDYAKRFLRDGEAYEPWQSEPA